MRRRSNEQLDASKWNRLRKVSVPSWWLALAPGKGSRFWGKVESMRKEAGVHRGDYSGIAYIVDQLSKGV